jgi:cytochrome c553
MKPSSLFLLAIFSLLTSGTALADPLGKAIFYCASCHGPDGNSTASSVPRIGGQDAAYLASELEAFRTGRRIDPHGMMQGMANSLDAGLVRDVATYFASQRPVANAPVDPALARLGKLVYENGIAAKNVPACVACHGPAGRGGGGFPSLAGQNADYLVQQLQWFREKQGPRGDATLMQPVVAGWDFSEAEAVAAYLQSAVK